MYSTIHTCFCYGDDGKGRDAAPNGLMKHRVCLRLGLRGARVWGFLGFLCLEGWVFMQRPIFMDGYFLLFFFFFQSAGMVVVLHRNNDIDKLYSTFLAYSFQKPPKTTCCPMCEPCSVIMKIPLEKPGAGGPVGPDGPGVVAVHKTAKSFSQSRRDP